MDTKNPQCTNSNDILPTQIKIHTNDISLINGTMMAITDSAPFVQLFSEPVSNSASFQAISPQVTYWKSE